METESTVNKVRCHVYRLLAEGFRKPDALHFVYLTSEYLLEWQQMTEIIAEKPGGVLMRRLQETVSRYADSDLLEEYTQLYEPHGQLLAPPYETEYTKESPQHSLTQSAQLADISGFYQAFGLEVSETLPDRVDHVATELEFMHILSYKEAYALENHETEHLEIVQDAQQKFLNDHCSKWATPFKLRLHEADQGEFYKLLGSLTDWWINLDKDHASSQEGACELLSNNSNLTQGRTI